MKHFVFRKVLFTVGKDYEGNNETLKMKYVNCQWENTLHEICEVDILSFFDEIDRALQGDKETRETLFLTFAHYLMLDYKPNTIS